MKNVLAGTTTVAHHDPRHASLDDPAFPVDVLRESGWCHSLGLSRPHGPSLTRYGPAAHASFIATHASHPWIIHLAEGTDGVAAAELAALDALGCLSGNTVLVHGVGLTDADVERIIDADAAVVWCPSANLGMLGRTLAPRRLFDAGRLTLGTDSRLTGSRDLLDELRVAAANSDLKATELLRLVTADASRVLRLPAVGGLRVGQQADAVIVRAGEDPHATLRDARRSDIRAVMRRGLPVIADPDFSEWFVQSRVETVAVRLDGRPKLMERSLARSEVMGLEPGLEYA